MLALMPLTTPLSSANAASGGAASAAGRASTHWTDEVVETIQSEFSDIPDTAQIVRLLLRLTLAALLGGVLGIEREHAGKAAGVRTHMLVSLGAALFVLVPQQGGMPMPDMSRVLQGVIAGIGFLGAGAILKLKDEEQVHGLTTAAGIWMTAAIGVACGLGREATAVVSTLLALAVLTLVPHVTHRLTRRAPDAEAEAAPPDGRPNDASERIRSSRD